MVTPGKASRPLRPNPCWDGHPRAAAEHARQMQMARVRLDHLLGLSGQPSSYSLPAWALAGHIRELRNAGWQGWEIRARFDFGAAA
jgi:hypothetical protein